MQKGPGRGTGWGFRLEEDDDHSPRWWPQGVTTSADAHRSGTVRGRKVVITSAYAKELQGVSMGARITVHDVTEPDRVRYRHVLLVEAVLEDAELRLRPVQVHAGGLLWHGRYLHVAATARGMVSFRLDDIVEVPPGGRPHRLHLDGHVADAFGFRYVLPVAFRYAGCHAAAVAPLRFSFLSLDPSTTPYHLVVGEYGRRDATTRLARFALDGTTGLPRTDRSGLARPVDLDVGVEQMQGAVTVGGRHYLSTSNGRRRRGSLWTGRPGAWERHPRSLPIGPEDLSYDPLTDRLWSVSEYPGRRFVYTLDRSRFD